MTVVVLMTNYQPFVLEVLVWSGFSKDGARGDVRDELIRPTQPVLSNKDQMLGMPQFGLRDNLIKCELLKNEDVYTYIQNYRCATLTNMTPVWVTEMIEH